MDASQIIIYIGIPIIVLLLSAVVYFFRRLVLTVDGISEQMPYVVKYKDCERAQNVCKVLRDSVTQVTKNGVTKVNELSDRLEEARFKTMESRIDDLFHMISNRELSKVRVEP